MSVVSKKEIFSNRSSDSSGISETRVSRVWRVVTNDTEDDPVTIFASGLFPGILTPHPNNPFLLARRAQVNQEKGAFIWLVTIEYSSKENPQELQDQEAFNNPLMRPARVSGGARKDKKTPKQGRLVDPTTRIPGADAVPFVNSAGDPYDSLEPVDDSIWVIDVTFNANPVPDWFWDYENSTNDDDVLILNRTFPRGTLKIADMRFGEYKQEQGIWFYELGFQLEYRAEERFSLSTTVYAEVPGHFYIVADRGFNKLVAGNRTEIRLSLDDKPTAPQLLDGLGGQLASPQTATPIYRVYAVHPERDFAVLPYLPMAPSN